ncbi:MAG TPA: CDP-alcohol phosphatidyltransferase family protein [Acidimicrobiales bacterium]|nr:CDP-alcohol phosphatidyltransferase family protein [Acidimicrobiales bacterium]
MFDGRFRSAVEEGVAPVGTSLGSRRLKADHLTLLGLVLSAACAVCIATGHLLIGLVLLILAAVPDLLDGAVAKATGTASVRGAFFDSVSDRVVDSMVLGGVAWYLASTKHAEWAVLPMAVLAVSNLISYERAKAESLGLKAKGGLMERAERIIALCIGLLVPAVLVPVLWVMLALTSVTAVQRFVKVWRQAPGPGAPPDLDQLRKERAEVRAERAALRAERAALRANGDVASRWREWRAAREAELLRLRGDPEHGPRTRQRGVHERRPVTAEGGRWRRPPRNRP